MFALPAPPAGLEYVDRGDIDAHDKIKTDLTLDGSFHDIDLSAIVGSKKAFVMLRVYLQCATVQASFIAKTKDNSNDFNITESLVMVANVPINYDVCIETDDNGFIEYKASNVTWGALSLLVRGWFE